MRSESLRSARELAGQAALVARDSGATERGQVPRRPPINNLDAQISQLVGTTNTVPLNLSGITLIKYCKVLRPLPLTNSCYDVGRLIVSLLT